MQFTSVLAALAGYLAVVASPAVVATPVPTTPEGETYLVSHAAMLHWLATTDATLTIIGDPINPLAPRSAQNTMVTYCSSRTQNVCGGACTFYNGGATCLNAPNTNCLAATHNVGFCDRAGCGHSCNQLSTCGTRLDDGFCFTPGTRSIIVPPA